MRRHDEFLLFARRLASGRIGRTGTPFELGLKALALPTAIRSPASCVRMSLFARTMSNRKRFKLAIGTRLVFCDGTPDILAYPKNRAAYAGLRVFSRAAICKGRRAVLCGRRSLDQALDFQLAVLPNNTFNRTTMTRARKL